MRVATGRPVIVTSLPTPTTSGEKKTAPQRHGGTRSFWAPAFSLNPESDPPGISVLKCHAWGVNHIGAPQRHLATKYAV